MQILQKLNPFSIEFPFFVCFCWKSFLFCLSERRLRDYGEADSLQKDNDQDVKWRVRPKNVSKWYCNFHVKIAKRFSIFSFWWNSSDEWRLLIISIFLNNLNIDQCCSIGRLEARSFSTSSYFTPPDSQRSRVLRYFDDEDDDVDDYVDDDVDGYIVDSMSKPMLIKISPSTSFHQGGSLSCKEIFIRLAPDINGPLSKLKVMYHEHQIWKHCDGKSFGIDHLGHWI